MRFKASIVVAAAMLLSVDRHSIMNPWAMFGSHKVPRKEKKNAKENVFLMFGFTIENTKENKK